MFVVAAVGGKKGGGGERGVSAHNAVVVVG